MYVKWIVCSIRKGLRKEFSNAQEKWIETQKAEGFVGQVGGWDINNENDACIISFWENRKSLEFFMRNIHDKIFYGNKQSEIYESISVVYFENILEIKGSSYSLTEAIKHGKLLSISDCSLNYRKADHFEKIQKAIWLPRIKKSNGMLGGLFSKTEIGIPRYLVSTFWDSIKNHNNYVKNKLPIFRAEIKVDKDIDIMIGKQVLLIDSWRIIKNNVE